MLTLSGRVLRKRDRLRLAYEASWLTWSASCSREWRETGTQPASTFPSFREWLTARTEDPQYPDRSEQENH